MWILHLADKLSSCPSLPNLNLGHFQSKCLDFYNLSTDIAVFPVLIWGKKKKQNCPFGFVMQKLWFWKFFKELRVWTECLGNVGGRLKIHPLCFSPSMEFRNHEHTVTIRVHVLSKILFWSAWKVSRVSSEVQRVLLSAGEAYFYLVLGDFLEAGRKHSHLGAVSSSLCRNSLWRLVRVLGRQGGG